MKLTLAAALLTSTCLALPTSSGQWPGHGWSSQAVYFLRVDPSGSSVVAVKVGSNGLLEDATSVTSTGGNGLQSQNATSPTLAPVAIDPLQGQQAVSVGGNYLFTINSGSNTAVMFSIDPEDPLKLSMVGQPVPTLGEFAMSIAYSSKYQKACVLNGGFVNGVACFSVDPQTGLVPDGAGLRAFGLAGTTPAQLGGAKGSGSDIQFSIDSSKVIAMYKGNNKPRTTLGHLFVYDVDGSGNVATTSTENRVSPLQAPFGFALNGNDASQMYVSDPTFGGVLVSLDYSTDKISAIATVNDTSFAASCWAVWSDETNTYYDINAASPNIGRVNTAGVLSGVIEIKKDLGGAEDTVASGANLYMLTSTNALAVVSAKSGKVLQVFRYSTATDRPYWTGMAMYPASSVLTGGV